MGTSAGYSLPTGGNWSKVKREVTSWVSTGATDTQSIGHVASSFVAAHHGASQAAQQMSHAAQAGSRFAGFASGVAQNGLSETLTQFNLGQYIGRSASEVLRGIRNFLIGDNSLLEDDIVQNGFVDFYEEQLLNDNSFEELERTLKQADIGDMLLRFFGHCIYRQFVTEFHERMMSKVDIPTTQHHLALMKDYIFTNLRVIVHGKNLTTVDWNGNEGRTLSARLLEGAWKFSELDSAY